MWKKRLRGGVTEHYRLKAADVQKKRTGGGRAAKKSVQSGQGARSLRFDGDEEAVMGVVVVEGVLERKGLRARALFEVGRRAVRQQQQERGAEQKLQTEERSLTEEAGEVRERQKRPASLLEQFARLVGRQVAAAGFNDNAAAVGTRSPSAFGRVCAFSTQCALAVSRLAAKALRWGPCALSHETNHRSRWNKIGESRNDECCCCCSTFRGF